MLWREISPVSDVNPTARKGHTMLVSGNVFIMFGGYGNNYYNQEFWFYNTSACASPPPLPPPHVPRRVAAAVSCPQPPDTPLRTNPALFLDTRTRPRGGMRLCLAATNRWLRKPTFTRPLLPSTCTDDTLSTVVPPPKSVLGQPTRFTTLDGLYGAFSFSSTSNTHAAHCSRSTPNAVALLVRLSRLHLPCCCCLVGAAVLLVLLPHLLPPCRCCRTVCCRCCSYHAYTASWG
jgi:hypothetical protein